MPKAILIIGQGPSKSGEGKPPLEGKSGSGASLAKLAGVSVEEMHEKADAINVLNTYYGKNGKGDKFPMDLAQDSAKIIKKGWATYDRVILLGEKVAEAFGITNAEPLTWLHTSVFGEKPLVAVIPHPSGVNRWYNDPQNRDDAVSFLKSVFGDQRVPTDGDRKSRAEFCTEYIKALERRFDWLELVKVILEVEQDKLFLEVGAKTFDEWITRYAPTSYSLCYAMKSRYKALKGSFTLDQLRKIRPESAEWLSKAKNISPAMLSDPKVQEASALPKKKMIEKLKADLPDQHIESVQKVILKLTESQKDALLDAYESYKWLKPGDAGSLEEFVEFCCVAEWMESTFEDGSSVRDRWERHKDDKEKQPDQAPQEKAESAVAAV